jgi:hypothetical protein
MKPADPSLVHEPFAEIVERVRAAEIVPLPPLTEVDREGNPRARCQRQQIWGTVDPEGAGTRRHLSRQPRRAHLLRRSRPEAVPAPASVMGGSG